MAAALATTRVPLAALHAWLAPTHPAARAPATLTAWRRFLRAVTDRTPADPAALDRCRPPLVPA